MTSGVYEIVNMETGKRYIGGTVNLEGRKANHFSTLRGGDHKNAHLQHEWNKYGASVFEFLVVLKCPSKDLIAREQERIDSYDFESLYNMSPTAGSSLGRKFSDVVKKKMSAAKIGNQNSLGHVHDAEVRARMSAAQRGHRNFLGHVHSAEVRAKLSAAAKKQWTARKEIKKLEAKLTN